MTERRHGRIPVEDVPALTESVASEDGGMLEDGIDPRALA